MLDIKFVRDNPDAVKENIKKKFQDAKLPLVDEVIEKDAKYRECLKEVESLKAARNKLSKANGPLFGQLKKCTDEAQKAQLQAQIDANNAAVKADADKMAELEAEEAKLADRIQEIMYTIPQMIDPSVPIGPDDTYNVEAQRFGEPVADLLDPLRVVADRAAVVVQHDVGVEGELAARRDDPRVMDVQVQLRHRRHCHGKEVVLVGRIDEDLRATFEFALGGFLDQHQREVVAQLGQVAVASEKGRTQLEPVDGVQV